MNDNKNFLIKDLLVQIEKLDCYMNKGISYMIYMMDKFLSTYFLNKSYKPQKIKKVNLPPELKVKYDTIDINDMVSTKLIDTIIQFIDVMTENFSKEDLINFYNNINTLKTLNRTCEEQNFMSKKNAAVTVGSYYAKKNEITVDENYFMDTIFHELLHMASSVYKIGMIYSGFRQTSLKLGVTYLGSGINEGYTELLNRRYFSPNSECSYSYEFEVIVVKMLEKIVDQDKMEKLYLNANMPGLIEQLKQYSSEEEIMSFIANNDFILENFKDEKSDIKKMISNCIKNIYSFLIESYSKKLLIECQKGGMNNNELSIELAKYAASITSELCDYPYSDYISEDELIECFTSVFGKENDKSILPKLNKCDDYMKSYKLNNRIMYYNLIYYNTLNPDMATFTGVISKCCYNMYLHEKYVEKNGSTYFYCGFEDFVAKGIQEIIGYNKIMKTFSYHPDPDEDDFIESIHELKQYLSEEEFIKFISNIDFIQKYLDEEENKVYVKENENISNSLKEINELFIKLYSNKLLSEVDQNNIMGEDILNKIVEYTASLPKEIYIKGNCYQLLSGDELREYFEIVCEKVNESLVFLDDKNVTVQKK